MLQGLSWRLPESGARKGGGAAGRERTPAVVGFRAQSLVRPSRLLVWPSRSMGLQRWTPGTAALSSMACLHVESPSICRGKFKSALKTPAAFHERIHTLERARKGNLLKHKLCSRAARSQLARMHILQETEAQPSLQTTQMKLKRARLADELDEKIDVRPAGPMELVEKNILPVDGDAKEMHKGDDVAANKSVDVYRFDDDNTDALSTLEPRCSTPLSAASSSTESTSSSSSSSSSIQHSSPSDATSPRASEKPEVPSQPSVVLLIKQIPPKTPAEKSRGKKSREAKPRIRKLKYHQYIPPDQKQELQPMAARMDSAYGRILQQQQQFLQLQILRQQHYCQQGAPPATHKSTAEVLSENCNPHQLPANVDEMKVAELKVELKLRSLPVSGTKTDLIERLKVYHENAVSMETSPPGKLTPPVSPVASKVSSRGPEDGPAKCAVRPGEEQVSGEKDRRLHEKERQIEELKRKLEKEQRLVEELKLQLEVEKRSQQGDSPPRLSPPPLFHRAKEEPLSLSSCSAAAEVKQEEDGERGYLALSSNGDGALPVSVRRPGNGIKMRSSAASVLVLASGPGPAKIDDSAPLTKFPDCGPQSPPLHQPAFILPQLKCKKLREPPRYEDAVKHTRMATAAQGVSAASQQMDDLFDVLIESGEISPFIKQEPPSMDKRLPVTPSVTLLPVNTVLSRPPPLVQVAHMPPTTLAPDPRLDSLLSAGVEEPLKLIEELHSELHAMDWLDLTLCSPAEGVDAAAVSAAPEGVFTADFLTAHELL
ncbi:myocardin-related transcription factor B isoform X2 [Nerophis ophidion]|uniref:myocardin-related transcription factor B isoform X2 n=1 Tax=Nerophis ophidion TaxID=159077 RepID=UPI002ADFD08D|nr:myocardin-related transcription factor B isoform X2 [Nerophis ophidion]